MDNTQMPMAPLHNLLSGVTAQFPRKLDHPKKKAVISAIVGAEYQKSFVDVIGTAFSLYVNMDTVVPDGTGYFWICFKPGDGREDGTVLYTGAVACQLATAPLAWRHIMAKYLDFVSEFKGQQACHAPGLMPRDSLPWACGFNSDASFSLSREERADLYALIVLSSLYLMDRCEHGFALGLKAGHTLAVDSDLFPELRDWAD
jgi:hypothetical protein